MDNICRERLVILTAHFSGRNAPSASEGAPKLPFGGEHRIDVMNDAVRPVRIYAGDDRLIAHRIT